MVKAELVKRSPLRILEKNLHGGMGVGNLGVIASARGVGKTACLVHIATDQLIQGKYVIHISFAGRTDHIMSWYDTIFREIAKTKSLESALEVHDELIKHRVIMNFNQGGISVDQLTSSLRALIGNGNFKADTVVIDGYDFAKADPSFVAGLKKFAAENKLTIWLSVDATDIGGLPAVLKPYAAQLSVVLSLQNNNDYIKLKVLKYNDSPETPDLNLRLDTKTLLIADGSE